MEKLRWNPKWGSLVGLLAVGFFLVFFFVGASSQKTPVRKILRSINHRELNKSLRVQLLTKEPRREVIIDNGIVQVTLSSPDGFVTGIKYHGIDNVLENKNEDDNRGYWDVVWYEPGKGGSINIDKLKCTDFRVITVNEDQVEVSFTRKWNIKLRGSQAPLNVDKRFIVRRGSSGFYYYAILEREEGWPDVDMDQIRIVFKLQQDMFHVMAIKDGSQRTMPMMEDRESGQPLAYPEAVLLTNPINQQLRGEVDDKYQYSLENKDNRVHGWMTTDDTPVGFWMITPSDEFRSGGPIKQDLTSHVGPTVLNMFTSTHYGGKDINTEYRNGEAWKKVLGPSFVYLNSGSSTDDNLALWEDAKNQMFIQVKSWPYNFIKSEDFPKHYQRGSVFGQLKVHDRYMNETLMGADSAYVGLAAPGDVGSFQIETKGYQFWTKANKKGYFSITNVREGNYSLYAWVPGVIGDFKYKYNVTVTPGSRINLEVMVYEPPRNGPTLWEIGIPDRSAAEFFIPDAYPTLMNHLYTSNPDKFRQYGLWERYTDLYRNEDLKYTIGVSDYTRDWFFAQVTRNIGNKTYEATTWQIIFKLKNWKNTGNYKLQLALAAATQSDVQVRFNNANTADSPLFSTGLIGKDNAIARHGIHGLYKLYSIDVPSDQLQRGSNILYLTQSRHIGPFQGVMYDYIRLEGPPGT
ncbi:hypothetical protein ACOSQ3_023910 [Xanthoceras sorbifolium]